MNEFQAFKSKTNNKLGIWTGSCQELHDTLFWMYVSVIFGCNVFWYVLRILRYKMGFLTLPIPPYTGGWYKRHRKKRFYMERDYCKGWKYKKKMYYTNPAKCVSQPAAHNIKYDIATKNVFFTVLNIDDRVERCGEAMSFDSDSQTVVCDNSANVHICRARTYFVGDIKPCNTHRMATIGGRGHAPGGTGTVRWSWFDDEGVQYEFLVENVLYFP